MPTDGLLDLAITIVLEWGPDIGRPVTTRLMERAPGVDLPRAEALEAEAQRIKYEAFALAERAWHGEMTPDAGRAELGAIFPDLVEATLDNLWNKGGYYAWHG
jgi:hypothetical protein